MSLQAQIVKEIQIAYSLHNLSKRNIISNAHRRLDTIRYHLWSSSAVRLLRN